MIGLQELALVSLVIALVVVVPRLRMAAASWIDESDLAARSLEQIRSRHRVVACRDPVVTAILEAFAKRAELRVPRLRALVVERPGLNAAALADGTVVLWAELVDAVHQHRLTRDELAGVLAHELAHIELGHGRQRAASELLARPFVRGLGFFRGGLLGRLLLGGGLDLLRKGASRRAELEADALAVTLLRQAGFSPDGLARFLERLARQGAREPTWGAWLSTHPHTAARLHALGRAPGETGAP